MRSLISSAGRFQFSDEKPKSVRLLLIALRDLDPSDVPQAPAASAEPQQAVAAELPEPEPAPAPEAAPRLIKGPLRLLREATASRLGRSEPLGLRDNESPHSEAQTLRLFAEWQSIDHETLASELASYADQDEDLEPRFLSDFAPALLDPSSELVRRLRGFAKDADWADGRVAGEQAHA